VFSYFAYHAVEGDRGLRSWLKLRQEIADAKSSEAELAAERDRLERRVALLRPESLDRDMLEERARAVLNLARPEDRVILLDRGQ
ncbi:MAG TPA: septum formation initiator family protein, partial [Alphaproteobacteria bacterium]|nr:septum formation initiator family protein [Alphaproteobacteria bacterium]